MSFNNVETLRLDDLQLESGQKELLLEFFLNNKNIVNRKKISFVFDNPELLKYLVSIGYNFLAVDLKTIPLSTCYDYEIMAYAIEQLKIFNKYNYDFIKCFDYDPVNKNLNVEKYKERIVKLYHKAIQTFPTINNFKSIFMIDAEAVWKDYRNKNIDDYANIFCKICIELKNNDNFYVAIKKMDFMDKMKHVLGEKYNLLILEMEQYHSIIHNNKELNSIDVSRNLIAKMSALYVSICKENYKKQKINEYFEDVKKYFIPKKNNPVILKKISEYKQKQKFQEMYIKKDEKIYSFLKNIVDQNSMIMDEKVIWDMIDNFLINDYSKLNDFIKEPLGWNDYKRFRAASKLINRLNNKYIKYTDLELVKYLDIIKYDANSDNYYYDGPLFDEILIFKYNDYQKKIDLYNNLKKQIIFKSKDLKINDNISKEELDNISSYLPFNDNFFEFDQDKVKLFTLQDFISKCMLEDEFIKPSSILNDDSYEVLSKYAIGNGMFWLLLLSNYSLYDKSLILETFDYIDEVVKLSKIFNYDINNYEDVLALSELGKCADEQSIAILGQDLITSLCKSREYTKKSAHEIVKMAKELVCSMVKKDKATVPYVCGQVNNYIYSIYDSYDVTILESGIDTNACFRIDGNENDFFHYCALDKNGIVIKITDSYGNFVGRAAGFRNGNGVYINQLRTIYDRGGYGYYGISENEKLDIIETFKMACNDIVETSQKNENEVDKIDFVLATKSYALNCIEDTIDRDVTDKIGRFPMDVESKDWENFVNSTSNLQEVKKVTDKFTTDYGNYSLICMAHSKDVKLEIDELCKKDVEAVYDRPRNKILITSNPENAVINKINRIKAINSFYNKTKFESCFIPKDALIFTGDNWYIVCDNGNIVESCLLEFDSKAKIEFEASRSIINKSVTCDLQNININDVDEIVQVLKMKK